MHAHCPHARTCSTATAFAYCLRGLSPVVMSSISPCSCISRSLARSMLDLQAVQVGCVSGRANARCVAQNLHAVRGRCGAQPQACDQRSCSTVQQHTRTAGETVHVGGAAQHPNPAAAVQQQHEGWGPSAPWLQAGAAGVLMWPQAVPAYQRAAPLALPPSPPLGCSPVVGLCLGRAVLLKGCGVGARNVGHVPEGKEEGGKGRGGDTQAEWADGTTITALIAH